MHMMKTPSRRCLITFCGSLLSALAWLALAKPCFTYAQEAPAPSKPAAEAEAVTLPISVYTVGQKYLEKSITNLNEEVNFILDGQEVYRKQMHVQATLETEVEILAVDAEKQPYKLKHTVRKVEGSIGAEKAELPLKKGAVVVLLHAEGKVDVTVDGEAAEPQLNKLFTELSPFAGLAKSAAKAPTLQESLGMATPRKPGETWNLPTDKFQARLAASFPDLEIKDGSCKGTVSFRKLRQSGGDAIADLVSSMEFDLAGLDMVPDGLELTRSKVNSDIRVHQPLNASFPPTKTDTTGSLDLRAAGKAKADEDDEEGKPAEFMYRSTNAVEISRSTLF